jgi:hypothetical protein
MHFCVGSGDPTFIVGRHSVRFGDGLERAKCLHAGESRDGPLDAEVLERFDKLAASRPD